MSRYIDADVLMEHLQERYDVLYREYGRYDHYTNGYGEATELIEEIPTADVVEVRHGEWGFNRLGWTCSECDGYGGSWYKYCPHCGAKMDGERKDDDKDN